MRVAVELRDRSGSAYWADLTVGRDGPLDLSVTPPGVVRIRASDLRAARRIRERIRAEAQESGREPDTVTVLVDLEAVVDTDARIARRLAQAAWRERPGADTLSYVGTPRGLASLIADIHAVRVADGVTVVPAMQPSTVEHLVDGTLPLLQSRGLLDVSPSLGELRRRFSGGRAYSALAS